MSIFDELNTAYDGWRQNYFDNYRRAVVFSEEFSNEFRKHIGAPETLEPFPGHEMVSKYVWSCRANLIHEENAFQAVAKATGYDEVIQVDDQGRFYFALAIRCEHGPMTWPKEWFPVLIFFSFNGNKVDMQITNRGDGVFSLWTEDKGTWVSSFNFIVSVLQSEFARNFPDRAQRREQIGFVVPVVPLPANTSGS